MGVRPAKCGCRLDEVSICGSAGRECVSVCVRVCLCVLVCVWPTSSVIESREDVASSYRRMGGFFRTARAMATRCFSPPETKKHVSLERKAG